MYGGFNKISEANRQIIRFWTRKGDFDKNLCRREVNSQGPKCHIIQLVHGEAGLVGPYFIEEMQDEKKKDYLNCNQVSNLIEDCF